jgi:peroxiredoxin
VLGASFDPIAANKAFCDKFAYPYKLLSFSKDAGKAWGAFDPTDEDYPLRISYLIGPEGRIVKAYAEVDVAAHPAQVLADLARG